MEKEGVRRGCESNDTIVVWTVTSSRICTVEIIINVDRKYFGRLLENLFRQKEIQERQLEIASIDISIQLLFL
jgi:hypothetical protein